MSSFLSRFAAIFYKIEASNSSGGGPIHTHVPIHPHP